MLWGILELLFPEVLPQKKKTKPVSWSYRALTLGLLFACWVLSTALNERAQAPQIWPMCEQCGHRLCSKGVRARQMTTLIGVVR